ncbi:Aldo/keto reductase [Laetiporus sulphureus 93-53]|uniref:Aldo/keto reductase n=1 Tax=Laetiporus sulphureus 93-53 TaxID=1314785 RepID=A0A165BH74_9APHY|nr:Aldo/keto reductase [Laetiporus sulphureus 93-53]KZT01050.1 Aldo/keto reductase [Laetiporus sulphureus 93-53]
MPATKYVKLNTGALMPTLGLGTWKSAPGLVEKAVEIALKDGYRHIDTATAYANEKEVGIGIKASGVRREEIFLTTKLANSNHRDPEKALEYSLTQLDTPYLDLWLMHWPCPMKDGKPDHEVSWIDTWKKMEKIYKAHPDKVRAIGVSNVSLKYMEDLLKVADVVPAVNQIESHPSCKQEELTQYCWSKGISITAYSPLGSDNAPLAANSVIQEIATAHGVAPSTVLISFHANRPGVTVVPKSVTPERILANAKIIDLTDEDMQRLNDIEKTNFHRQGMPFWTGYKSIGFPDLED